MSNKSKKNLSNVGVSAFDAVGNIGTAVFRAVGNIGTAAVNSVSRVATLALSLAKKTLSTTGVIGGVIAFFNTQSFIGWSGVGKSALVGLGTSLGGTVGSIGGALGLGVAGAVTGGILGASLSSRGEKLESTFHVGALFGVVGLVGGAFGGYGYGVIKGYDMSKEAVIKKFEDKKINTSFNDTVSGKTVELDRQNFTATIKTLKPYM